jgi:glycine/D-amino acid oxidase-like deaminating enzyme
MTWTEAVVVGRGAMGAATAYELGRRGVASTLLEQFAIGHERGSSRASGAPVASRASRRPCTSVDSGGRSSAVTETAAA